MFLKLTHFFQTACEFNFDKKKFSRKKTGYDLYQDR